MSSYRVLAVALVCGGVAACGTARNAVTAGSSVGPRAARSIARWTAFTRASVPVDLAGPRRDGTIVMAAGGRLWLLHRSGAAKRFAPKYARPGGEPYIALATSGRKGCSFGRATVYALRLTSSAGVDAVDNRGHVRDFARLTAPGLLNGIAFDNTGRFGYRLLVTVAVGSRTTIYAINCRGHASTLTTHGPRVEGGIAVAPRTFGRFAGDLIAPDELSGRIYAIDPRGGAVLMANSHLHSGQDTGVESEAFVPGGRHLEALLADRLTPGNPHPGDNLVLGLTVARLGVRPGDLLIATEGGALTDAVSCGRTRCRVREVAAGPAIAHPEGHIAFVPWR